MAFRSNGPIMLALPPFRGATRRIILIALVSFLLCSVLGLVSGGLEGTVTSLVGLHPDPALHRLLWEFLTYPFIGEGLLSTVFALLTMWFFGSAVEDDRGSRWFTEYFLIATVGGGLLASLICVAVWTHVPALNPALVRTNGMWPADLALLLAYGRFHAEETISFNFVFQIKAKYLVAIYLLFYLMLVLLSRYPFDALTTLCNALCGYAYLQLAPRGGVRKGASEQWFGLRNSFYRYKRRRAAKKFTVYMRKQGRDANIDASGRYVDPDAELRDRRNPGSSRDAGNSRDMNDKRWMN
jgi:membrane associated rhomboid family serine protease